MQMQSAMQEEATLVFPMSSGQRRLWFLQQLEPQGIEYNLISAFHLKGLLNKRALEKSFCHVIDRHEGLRTIFAEQAGEPVQIVIADMPFELSVAEIGEFQDEQEYVQKWLEAESRQPFDLQKAPLLRARLLVLNEQEHILSISMHHIISDGWSMGIFYREISQCYKSLMADIDLSFPQLPIQYADYAEWQQDRLDHAEVMEQLTYWKEQLSGDLPIVQISSDRPRPLVQRHRGNRQVFELSEELLHRLKDFSRQEGVTLFMTTLAIFQALISRYTGQKDLLVGTPIANRNREEVENVIGFFVNTLVLRNQLNEGMSFRDLLQQVRTTSLGAFEHQDVPFEKLVAEVSPERSQGYLPLVQVLFGLQNAASQHLALEGLEVSWLEVHNGTSKFDLAFIIEEVGRQLRVEIEYDSDLFDDSTITRLFAHYQMLLDSALANPDHEVAALRILLPEEEALMAERNQTTSDFPYAQLVHEWIGEQAQRHPSTAAVVYEGQSLTYRELNERANQLAHYLLDKEIGAGCLVGVCFERSIEIVVGILAVMKAGAAYVPLDPTYPEDRLRFIAEDAGLVMLLSQRELRDKVVELGTFALFLDSDWERLCQYSIENPSCEQTSDSIAYMIYTSGSTGQPKGVMVPHRGLVNLLDDCQKRRSILAGQACSCWASFSFDASIYEIFTALTAGGTLHVVPDRVRFENNKCVEWFYEHRIQNLFIPPFMIGDFVEWLRQREVGTLSLNRLMVGVESVSEANLYEIQKHVSGVQIINGYGPTETSIVSVAYTVPRIEQPSDSYASIGQPVQNMKVYLLDQNRLPVPIGVPGEIYLSGVGLARGYLNRLELTEERFVPNPFSDNSSTRLMYRTGDLARYLPDGNIQFLGRADFQVKIRGLRIELGEIETALLAHSAIKNAVVVVHTDERNQKQIVAYVVASGEETLENAELRRFVGKALPDYMVPAIVIQLPALPLTTNGKLDRKSLPVPSTFAIQEATLPRTSTEEHVWSIWSKVLGKESFGVLDNFFELGGHSLSAMQIVSQLNDSENQLPLRSIFSYPTIAELALMIEKEKQVHGAQVQVIEKVSREMELAASFAQHRLWFIDQWQTELRYSYNVPIAYCLRGRLDVRALEVSIQEIIRRHESLRTIFVEGAAGVRQVIVHAFEQRLELNDLSHLHPDEAALKLEMMMQQEARHVFTLSEGPLFRIMLIRLNENEHHLLFNVHHIIFDGWSTDIFIRELAVLYEACVQGVPHHLPELPIQYADFAINQQKWFAGVALQEQIAYWKRKLIGELPVLSLPFDRPRPAVQTFNGNILTAEITSNLAQEIKQLGEQEGSTLFMTMLAAFKVLLHRYSGQMDLLVGTPVAGRNHASVEKLIGFFVNMFVIRTDVSNKPTFRELMQQVRETTLEAFEHQDLPFDKLIEAIQPERSQSHSPVFQVMFAMNNISELPELRELSLDSQEIHANISKFDMTVTVKETIKGLRLSVEYNTDLFNEATIRRMLDHYRVLLQASVENPNERIQRLAILPEKERLELIVNWNKTEADLPPERLIHHFFEEQAAKRPDAIAIESEGEKMTYRVLNDRANQLAHCLIEAGVRPGTLVALYLNRSPEMIIGLLAILKAGGAYVPIDPAFPQDRITYMLEDSNALVVITESALAAGMQRRQAHLICIDEDGTEIGTHSILNPAVAISCQTVCYTIYTSGSTGKPKGVQITCQALLNLMLAAKQSMDFNENDVFLATTTISFDIANLEIFLPLMIGAQINIASQDVVNDPERLSRLLADSRASVMQATPTAWKMMIQSGWAGHKPLTILTGGEPLSRMLADELLKRSSVVWNCYGPTETTVYSTFWKVSERDETVLIGRPVNNTLVYVLDEQRQLTPIGVVGELYIGGVGVALGYLNRPELNAERFFSNPFVSDPGARMYRTGDYVRLRADGQLEYIGRLDLQVKIRGYRIEIGEIESVLGKHSLVRECAVNVYQDKETEDKHLIAYIVTQDGSMLDQREWRRWIKESLPDYMVPQVVVQLDQMPVTPNGKIDRKRLPEPISVSREGGGRVLPRTTLEVDLAKMWCDLLHLGEVGVFENFFELGGHSLLATRLVSRIRRECGIEIPLRALFELPTIAELAHEIAERSSVHSDATVSPIPVMRDARVPLSYNQQRLWFLNQLEPDNPFYNIPVGLRVSGEVDKSAFCASVEAIIERHEILRTTFDVVDGEAVQRIQEHMKLDVLTFDLRDVSELERTDRVVEFMQNEAQKPFSLSSGPLLRMTWLDTAAQEHIVVLVFHHICFDLWSVRVFLQELSTLYEAQIAGKSAVLPALPIQYVDYAYWQHRYMEDGHLRESMSYWKKTLAQSVPALELPTDRPRPPIQSYRGGHETIRLSPGLYQELQSFNQGEGTTMFMTLLAAFKVLLYRYSGQEDISVGIPIANRNRSEIEDLLGFFTNTLVMRNQVNGSMKFTKLLQLVRQNALDGYAHQDVPFEKVVEELQPNRDLSRTPLFQVMMAYLENGYQSISTTGIKLETISIATATSKFDLTLFVAEQEDRLDLTFEYNSDLFDRRTIRRMMDHLSRLLSDITQQGNKSVAELRLQGDEEHDQWMRRVTSCSDEIVYSEQPVQHIFEAIAAQIPDNAALRFMDEQMTYAQLNERANRLAHLLKAHNVVSDVPVGICMERSFDMIVAVLAIIKAGGAIVALDPQYPRERLAFIIDDANPRVIVTTRGWVEQVSGRVETAILCLDDLQDELKKASSANPEHETSLDQLLYLIYTSGSTGKPKGVAMPHRSLSNLIQWQVRQQDAQARKTLQFTSLTFDVSYQEILATICSGGELLLIADHVRRDPMQLLDVLIKEQVERLYIPFVGLQQLAEAAALYNQVPVHLKEVITAGEQLQISPSIRRLFANIPNVSLHNQYGPSESHVVTAYRLQGNADEWPQLPPIGTPVSKANVYIVDRDGQLAPAGVYGEIYIGGECLARGYLNLPDVTAEKFAADPFRLATNARMYRSGDVGRYLADGQIEYVGRIDGQVKIRGYRIELGEVEAVLVQHPSVKESAVTIYNDNLGEKRLAAYVVLNEQPAIGEEEKASLIRIRQTLQQKLPAYMVPHAITRLEAIPLTATGKIDRKALPAVTPSSMESTGVHYLAPVSHVERTISAVWSELLGVRQVGLRDNFFDLGGHSLLVVRACQKIGEALNRTVETMEMFKYPTVSLLAEALVPRSGAEATEMFIPSSRTKNQKEAVRKQGMRRKQLQQKTFGENHDE